MARRGAGLSCAPATQSRLAIAILLPQTTRCQHFGLIDAGWNQSQICVAYSLPARTLACRTVVSEALIAAPMAARDSPAP